MDVRETSAEQINIDFDKIAKVAVIAMAGITVISIVAILAKKYQISNTDKKQHGKEIDEQIGGELNEFLGE